jgi:hypothetical protein
MATLKFGKVRVRVSSEDVSFAKKFHWRLSPAGYPYTDVFNRSKNQIPKAVGFAIRTNTGKYATRVYLHRAIEARAKGLSVLKSANQKGLVVDHFNRVRTDARRSNLRFITQSENVKRIPKEIRQAAYKLGAKRSGGAKAIATKRRSSIESVGGSLSAISKKGAATRKAKPDFKASFAKGWETRRKKYGANAGAIQAASLNKNKTKSQMSKIGKLGAAARKKKK